MSTIDDLGNKVGRLKDQLRDAQEKYNAARIAEYPVKVGQQFTDEKGRRCQVTRIVILYDKIKPFVIYFKADGSLGQRTSEMYSWRKWTPVS